MARASAASAPPAPEGRSGRSPEQIYDRVKSMAMTFVIRPGERVNEVELARALNVSRTPVREALNRLMMEGFLTRAPNKGFIGRPLDARQVFDLYELRGALEAGSVRLACERATDAELEELEIFLRKTERPEDTAAAGLLALDEAFHESIARHSRNLELAASLKAVNARIHFFRWIDMQNGRRRHTQQEHARIVRALRARDADKAVALMHAHIAHRLDQIADGIRAGFAEIYMRDQANAPGATP